MKKKLLSILLGAAVACGIFSAMPVSAADGACTFRIVHTNDVHGYYKENDYGKNMGYAKLKTLIDANQPQLVLDIGDTFHGQSLATVEQGKGIADLIKDIGYDAMTPGNHDWSYGADRLKELSGLSGIPILASNIVTEDETGFFQTPYLVKEVKADNGTSLRVGIIGVIDDALYANMPDQNVKGLVFEEECANAVKTAETLKTDEKCDLVIAMTHQADCEGFVKGIQGIDVVLAGHEHKLINQSYTDAAGKSVPVFEAGCYSQQIGVLTLTVDQEAKTVSATEKTYDAEAAKDAAADPTVSAKITEIENRQQSVLGEVLGKSVEAYAYSWEGIRSDEEAIGRIVTAAYMEKTGADLAFENCGGIRAGLPEGDITYGDLVAISPYGNTLMTKQLTGQQILDVMEHSISIMLENRAANEKQLAAKAEGMDYDTYSGLYPFPANSGNALQAGGITLQYDTGKKEGSRILSAEIGGKTLDPEKTYLVAVSNYIGDSCEDYPEIMKSSLVEEHGTCEEALKSYISLQTFTEAAKKAHLVEAAKDTSAKEAPAKATVKKAVLKNGKLTVKMKKVKEADGYQVQAATDKAFQKNTKSWQTKQTSLTGKTWKSKTGYVRVRAYTKQDGGTLYGEWSDAKKMK